MELPLKSLLVGKFPSAGLQEFAHTPGLALVTVAMYSRYGTAFLQVTSGATSQFPGSPLTSP